MQLEIQAGDQVRPVPLGPGRPVELGGSILAGLAPELPDGLGRLEADGEQAILTLAQPLAVDGVLTPAGRPRLLCPGEQVELAPGVLLRLMGEPQPGAAGTRTLARGLLSGSRATLSEGPRLTCLTGLDMGRVFALSPGAHGLGRGLHADVRIRDRTVSRSHARIFLGDTGWWVEDLGSPNGTSVDGVRLLAPARLFPGAILALGHALLRFDSTGAPPPVPQPPGAAPPGALAVAVGPRAPWIYPGLFLGSALALAALGMMLSAGWARP